jgi:hypothetical protein
MGLGVFSSFQTVTQQSESLAQAEYRLGIIENQTAARGLKLDDIREARILLNEAQLRTERLIAANEVIQSRDAGFAETLSVINAITPDNVRVTTVDDDGKIVAVDAEAADYSILLGFIELLDAIPQFDHVQILNLSKSDDKSSDSGHEPAVLAGGPVVVGSGVQMSVEITRIFSNKYKDQSFSDEELAAAGTTATGQSDK